MPFKQLILILLMISIHILNLKQKDEAWIPLWGPFLVF